MTNMKSAIFTFSLLLFAMPAHAQKHADVGGGASPSSALNYSGGGSAGAGAGGMGFGFGFLQPTNPTRFQIVSAHGSSTYQPSTFVPYKEAVAMGIAAMTFKPKSIVEIAAECRASKQTTK